MGILVILFLFYLYTIKEKPLQRRLVIAASVPLSFGAVFFVASGGAIGLGMYYAAILGIIPVITFLWTFILVADIVSAKSPLPKDYHYAAIILAVITIGLWIFPSLLSSKVDLSI